MALAGLGRARARERGGVSGRAITSSSSGSMASGMTAPSTIASSLSPGTSGCALIRARR